MCLASSIYGARAGCGPGRGLPRKAPQGHQRVSLCSGLAESLSSLPVGHLWGGRMGLHCVFMGTQLTAPPLLLQDVPRAHGRGDTSPSLGPPRLPPWAPKMGGQARWQCCAEPQEPPSCRCRATVRDVCGRVPAKCSPQHLEAKPSGEEDLAPRESSLPCRQDLRSQVQQMQTQGPPYPLVVLRPQHDL